MLFASAPTFLAVALSAELHGRRAVPVAAIALAQYCSGLALSAFEGTMDARAARTSGFVDTSGLARTAAARALGSAAAVASAPTIIAATGLPLFSLLAGGVLGFAALTAGVRSVF